MTHNRDLRVRLQGEGGWAVPHTPEGVGQGVSVTALGPVTEFSHKPQGTSLRENSSSWDQNGKGRRGQLRELEATASVRACLSAF